MDFVETVCSRVLSVVEGRGVSLRAALSRHGAGVPRGVLHAVCLGVLRNYLLLERLLRYCGYRRPLRGTVRGWAPLVAAYTLAYRGSSAPREALLWAERVLGEAVAECVKRTSVEEVLSGLSGLARLSVEYSVPLWVVRKLAEASPPGGVEALLRAFQEPTPLWLRFNRARIGREEARGILASAGVVVADDPMLDDVFEVVDARPGALENLDRSLFYVQDRAALLVAHVLEQNSTVQPGVVADLFSAPGNKAAHLAWRTSPYAAGVELDARRAREEAGLLRKQRVDAVVEVVVGDASRPPLRGEAFDAVVVDPDCTSMGRLGHSPETRLFLEKAGPGIIARLQRLQKRALRAAAALAKQGGRILYTTCTLTLDENEKVVGAVVEEAGLQLLEARPLIGVWSSLLPKTQRIYPHTSRCTGGYVALLEKS